MLSSLDLSRNLFSSFNKSVEVVDGASLRELSLGSNSLQGPLPQWICKLKNLLALDLSNNHFTGSIPQCLKNSSSLSELRLRNNSLSGFLPDIFTNLTNLRSLDVSHNNFVGKLPASLINCTYMEFLSVKGNKIKDTFPFWLGSLELKILVLRSNAFHGPVYNPTEYLGFRSLRIINIADNDFVGSLPQDYFANWTQMYMVWSNEESPESEYMGDYTHMYEDSIDLVYKGVETDFTRIFQAFKAIDFSGNRFSGHIPGSIGLLSELRFLNLSGNAFTGSIPPSLSNITKLEALDLSRNNLSGEIPQGLGNLSFLSYINFSYNHLQGLVPQTTQFQSQKCSSFMGNSGLFGLEKICKENHVDVPVPTSQPPEESLPDPKEPVLNWTAASIVYGPGVFCGLVIGYIFTSYKHEWFIAR
ncbi:receptor like protein 38 [Raphanus sativus]|nr:receptor like protein 38 [Raphanus sativus]